MSKFKPEEVFEHIETLYECKLPVFIEGKPGIGKSEIVYQFAEKKGIEIRDIRVSLIDPVDLRGIPSTENGKTSWNPPSFFPDGGKGILFLDEINTAAPSVQAACYQLVLDRRVGEYKLPDGWMVIAAGNRDTDKAITFRMSSALRNRMSIVSMEPDFDQWKKYAASKNISWQIIAYLSYRTKMFSPDPSNSGAFPTPRSWFYVSQTLNGDFSNTKRFKNVMQSFVGEEASIDFVAWLKHYKDLPKIEEILKDPKNAHVPEEVSQKNSVAIMLAFNVKKNLDNLKGIFEYVDRLGNEMAFLFIKLLDSSCPEATTRDEFIDWVGENINMVV